MRDEEERERERVMKMKSKGVRDRGHTHLVEMGGQLLVVGVPRDHAHRGLGRQGLKLGNLPENTEVRGHDMPSSRAGFTANNRGPRPCDVGVT